MLISKFSQYFFVLTSYSLESLSNFSQTLDINHSLIPHLLQDRALLIEFINYLKKGLVFHY